MKLPLEIKTSRLVMRPLAAADETDFVAFLTEPGATDFMFVDAQKTESGARDFFEHIVTSYRTESPYFLLAISLRGGAEFVGTCGISGLPEENVREVFCCLAPKHRRQGYATEALRSLMAHCVAEYAVKGFKAYISPKNPRSRELAERLGMRLVGNAQHPIHGDGSILYSVEAGSCPPSEC